MEGGGELFLRQFKLNLVKLLANCYQNFFLVAFTPSKTLKIVVRFLFEITLVI